MKVILFNTNFRLLWVNTILTMMGDLTRMMLVGWLVLEITDSPMWVGINMGVVGLGMIALSNFGGVLADVLSRKMVAIVGGVIHCLIALFLVLSLYFNYLELWQLILNSFIWGAFSGIRIPATMALTLDVVEKKELLSANAAKFVGIGLAGIIGPILLIQVLKYFDNLGGFIFVAALEVFSVLVISKLSVPPKTFGVSGLGDIDFRLFKSTWVELLEGVHYIFKTRDVRLLILIGLLSEIFVWPHANMFPVIARDVLDVGVEGFGYLQSSGWFGLLVATLLLFGMGYRIKRRGLIMVFCALLFGILIIIFAFSRNLMVSMAVLSLAWASASIFEVTLITFLQSTVPDNMRGRVVGFQAFTWGTNAFSGFHYGLISQLTSVTWAIIINAIVFIVYTVSKIQWAEALSISDQNSVNSDSMNKSSS